MGRRCGGRQHLVRGVAAVVTLVVVGAAAGAAGTVNLGAALGHFQLHGNLLVFWASPDLTVSVHDLATGTTVDTGVRASFGFETDGALVAVTVTEQAPSVDLNGDGDALDVVLHVYDTTDDTVTNTRLAMDYFAFPLSRVQGGRVVWRVLEAGQGGSDLNGDGDALDSVLYLYDGTTGTATNVGLAASADSRFDGRRVAFGVREAAEGNVDLNGDGDAVDTVLHVYDTATGTTTNVGLAAAAFQLDGSRVAVSVVEFQQGRSDLNGDGDSSDSSVVHVHDLATAVTTNLALTGNAVLRGDRLAVNVTEGNQGNTDLNGDGDAGDRVIHVHDLATGTTSNVALAALPWAFDGERVALGVPESEQGNSDRNGDGDSSDFVLHVYDLATRTTTNVGLATAFDVFLGGGRVVLDVPEGSQGTMDLNGDGDVGDSVLHVYDVPGMAISNVGLAVSGVELFDGSRAVFSVPEEGNADLNGDGDLQDPVLHVYDVATGSTTNVGLAARFPQLDGSYVAMGVVEQWQGNTDLNGDGDTFDSVLHVYDVTSPVDSTPPVITPAVTGTLGHDGWFTSDVSVSWTVEDPDSPVAWTSGCEAVTITADTTGTTFVCEATSAGGTASSAVTVRRDATAPTVTCQAPPPSFLLRESEAEVSALVADGASGPSASTIATAVDTSTVGAQAVELRGSDHAGNETRSRCAYMVTYDFGGFASPVDPLPVSNAAAAGQTVALKWRILDANGDPVTTLTDVALRVTTYACPLGSSPDRQSEDAAGSSGLQNMGDGHYQLNWKTPRSYAGSCKTAHLDLGEGITRDALFAFPR